MTTPGTTSRPCSRRSTPKTAPSSPNYTGTPLRDRVRMHPQLSRDVLVALAVRAAPHVRHGLWVIDSADGLCSDSGFRGPARSIWLESAQPCGDTAVTKAGFSGTDRAGVIGA